MNGNNDHGAQNSYGIDLVNRRQEERILRQDSKYRAADGCLNKESEVQVDICLASEHSSDVAVHCCAGSMEENNLQCSRDGCVKRSTFAAAEKHCEEQGMRLCSVAELESGACCAQGCNWNKKISWTSDRCETNSLSSSSSNQSGSRPTRQSLRPSFQPTFSPSLSSQPTAIVSSFITFGAKAYPSFGTLFISLTLAGVLFLFYFVALGCHFGRKNQNINNLPKEEGHNNNDLSKGKGHGLFSFSRLSSFWKRPDKVSAPAEKEVNTKHGLVSISRLSPFWKRDKVSASAKEEANTQKEDGVGWYPPWLSTFLDEHNLQ